MDVLLARQHNLISCVLAGDVDGSAGGKHGSAQHRTLGKHTRSVVRPHAHPWHVTYCLRCRTKLYRFACKTTKQNQKVAH